MPFGRIFGTEVAIKVRDFLSGAFVAIGLDLLAASIIGISTTYSDEFLSPFMINSFAFALEIWCGGAANNGAFVPIEAEPFEGIFDKLGGTFDVAGAVCIFDTENKIAARLTC